MNTILTMIRMYREGYRAGFNGHSMLSGVNSYWDDPCCRAYIRAYRRGLDERAAN